jgi:hypothetical protein
MYAFIVVQKIETFIFSTARAFNLYICSYLHKMKCTFFVKFSDFPQIGARVI